MKSRLLSLGLCSILLMLPASAETVIKPAAKPTLPPEIAQYEAAMRKRAELLRDLVRQRRYNEALNEAGPYVGTVGVFIHERAKEANKAGKTGEALQRYKDFFSYYPFGEAGLAYSFHNWNPVAAEFVDLIKRTKNTQLNFELDAARIYQEILRTRQTVKSEAQRLNRCRQLTAQILEKYPASIFTPMAVNEAVWEADDLWHENPEAYRRIFEAYLHKLNSPKVPVRSYLLLLARYAEINELDSEKPAHLYKAVTAYQKIAALSQVEIEKRSALLKVGKTAMWLWSKDPKMRELSHTVFTKLIQSTPDSPEANEARQGLLDIYFSQKQTEQALKLVRQFEKDAKPGSDMSSLYFSIAQRLDEKAQESLFNEIIQRFPQGEMTYKVWLELANLHKRRGETEQEAAIYQRIAGETEPPTGRAGLYFRTAKSRAFSYLANEAEKKQEWEEALKWRRQWRSDSTCGNGAAMDFSSNTLNIYRCLMNLNRAQEAAEELEKGVLPMGIECSPKAMVTLVEHHRERGTLPALEERMQAMLKQKFPPLGAFMAQQYLSLHHAARQGDVASLWKTIQQKSHYGLDYLSWREKVGGKLLADLGETAKPFLLKQARAKQISPDEAIWACLLLAKMQAPETVAIVGEKLKLRSLQEMKPYLFLALVVHGGQEARAMLQSLAKEKDGSEAGRFLEAYPNRESVEFLEGDWLLNHGEPYSRRPLWQLKYKA